MLNDFLSQLPPGTRRSYASDARMFERWHGSPADAALAGKGQFHSLASAWRRAMLDDGLSPRTVKRRMAFLLSFAGYARRCGAIDWQAEAPSVRVQRPHQTGPTIEQASAMIAAASPRDKLALSLLAVMGLRMNEARGLDLAHVDRQRMTLSVRRKGSEGERTELSYPPALSPLLAGWLAERGIAPGPLLTALNGQRQPTLERLSERSWQRLVERAGKRAGVANAHPHALRHTAITAAMEAAGSAGIPVESVMGYSGHRDLATLLVYRDNLASKQGVLANMVAEQVLVPLSPPAKHAGQRVSPARTQ